MSYLGHNSVWVTGVEGGFRCGGGKESISDHEKIGDAIGGVGPEDELVDGKIRVWVGNWGQRGPMDGERRPFERVRDDEFVQ